MLQIVIYKKLNFWEEYTPLQLSPTLQWLIAPVNNEKESKIILGQTPQFRHF